MKTITFASGTHVGMVREENQDFFGKFPLDNPDLTIQKGQLFVIADGMGGHNAGRTASEMAVNKLAYYYFSVPNENIAECLRRAFREVNRQIHDSSTTQSEFEGMGTTCVALILRENHAWICHVGDSRAYYISKKRIIQITEDHSVVAQMIKRGILTKKEAKTHPQRSQLYRALGPKPELEIDIEEITVKNNDYFLLCTDGLYNHVSDKEMLNIVTSNVPQVACQELIAVANERGGQDNITLQIVHVERLSGSPLSRKTEK